MKTAATRTRKQPENEEKKPCARSHDGCPVEAIGSDGAD